MTGLGRRAIRRLARAECMVLFERDLLEPLPPPASSTPLSFEWLSEARLQDCTSLDLGWNRKALSTSRRRLRAGDRCLIGTVAGKPVVSLWITTSARELPGCRLVVGPDRAFSYKAFTAPRSRSLGYFLAIKIALLAECRRMGLRRVFSDVNEANRASVHAQVRVGFREVGRFSVVTLGGVRFTRMPAELRSRVSQ